MANHPLKGSKTKVMPIKQIKDVKTIKKMLKNEPRNYALYVIGINTALRVSDLARLSVGQVRGLKPGDAIEIKEKKTGKIKMIPMNKACTKAIAKLIERETLKDGDPLFKSRKKGGRLTVQSIHRLVKGWCRAINLNGNFGSHTLRKTFGYHRRVTFGRELSEVRKMFGHQSKRITMEYLCLQPEEDKAIIMDEL
jgi:integrase